MDRNDDRQYALFAPDSVPDMPDYMNIPMPDVIPDDVYGDMCGGAYGRDDGSYDGPYDEHNDGSYDSPNDGSNDGSNDEPHGAETDFDAAFAPVSPVQSVHPRTLAQNVQTTQPTTPVQPTQPVQPTTPVQPTQSVQTRPRLPQAATASNSASNSAINPPTNPTYGPTSSQSPDQDVYQAFTLLHARDLVSSAPMQWKMKGLVPWRGVGQVYGASMSAKTFLLIDYAVHQARGERWYNHRTSACPVVYICLEGQEGFKNRIRAYEQWKNITVPDSLQFILEPFDISHKGDVSKLALLIPKGALVIIDTQNASSPFIDENSAKDMGGIVDGAKRLAQGIDGFVMLVAHSGKDVTRGARGSSVQLPSWDFCMEVRRHGQDKRSFRIVKSKDGEDGKEHFFKLDLVMLGKDEDEDFITSCVASPDLLTKKIDKALTANQQLALTTLRRALEERNIESLHIDEWRPLFYSEHTGDTPDAKRTAFLNARKHLVNIGVVDVNSDYYSIY